MKILAFSGSNSSSSLNQALIKYCSQYLNIPCDIIDLRNYHIPMYSLDEEKGNGFSKDLMSLFTTFKSYEAYMISIPEHNGNFPAFFKNIIDWFTRMEKEFFLGKPILLLNASPGPNREKSVIALAKKLFPSFKGNVVETFNLAQFGSYMKNGKIMIEDEKIISELKAVIKKFESSLVAEQ